MLEVRELLHAPSEVTPLNKIVFAAFPLVLIACGGATADPTVSSSEPEGRAPDTEDRVAKDGGSPEAGECTSFAASGTSCEKDVRLFAQAQETCGSQGQYLNSFAASGACKRDGESKAFVVTCCTTPPSCSEGGGMGGPTCETNDSFFESAAGSCNGGALSQFETNRSGCQKGYAESASFTCACL
jgi:hypothetical protein